MEPGAKIAILALVGVGGYFAYEEVIRPYIAQEKLKAEAIAIAKKTGTPYKDALAKLGSAGCKAFAASEGVGSLPLVGSACDLGGSLVALGIVKGAPLAIKGLKESAHGTVAAAKAVGHAGGAVGSGVAHVVSKLKFWGLEGIHC